MSSPPTVIWGSNLRSSLSFRGFKFERLNQALAHVVFYDEVLTKTIGFHSKIQKEVCPFHVVELDYSDAHGCISDIWVQPRQFKIPIERPSLKIKSFLQKRLGSVSSGPDPKQSLTILLSCVDNTSPNSQVIDTTNHLVSDICALSSLENLLSFTKVLKTTLISFRYLFIC